MDNAALRRLGRTRLLETCNQDSVTDPVLDEHEVKSDDRLLGTIILVGISLGLWGRRCCYGKENWSRL